MDIIKSVLPIVADFLNEAKSLGLIKEFTLIQCEQISENAMLGTHDLLAKFVEKLRCANGPEKYVEHDTGSKEENMSEDSKIIETHIEKEDSLQMELDTNEENANNISSSSSEYEVVEESKTSEDEKALESPKKTIDLNQAVTNETSKYQELPKEKLVQIQVDSAEMQRRISAFIQRKRKEVDEWNVQEFCGRSYIDEQDPAWEQSNTCARVDVVFVPRRGSRSHIKVSKVKNLWGPQSQLQSASKKIKQEPGEMENQPSDPTAHAIEERLHNMESHLKLKSDSSLRSNIFQRLKDLENRILLLESTSPEYIHLPNSECSSPKKKSSFDKEKLYFNYSTDELKTRIKNLKESCKESTEKQK